LKGLYKHRVEDVESERICPRCDNPLQTIDLKLEGKFLIERCTDCLGLFFDPGELETLLDKSVSKVFHIDREQLETINKLRRHQDYPVTYIKCPVCRKLMNRINFGTQSGVIVDKCKNHGIWLDGGEMRHLMEWMKAGGKMLDQQKQLEMERIKRQKAERKLRDTSIQSSGAISHDYSSYNGYGTFGGEPDLLGTISRVVSRLFRFY
jgi:Zn-finger nucleic acid-binding protein